MFQNPIMERAMSNFNKETVGTAENTYNQPDSFGVSYGEVIEHLRCGGIATRNGWIVGTFIFKQVPSKVPSEFVERMSSLPQSVKDDFITDGISPDYQNQMAIVNAEGHINSWTASCEETFTQDWILL